MKLLNETGPLLRDFGTLTASFESFRWPSLPVTLIWESTLPSPPPPPPPGNWPFVGVKGLKEDSTEIVYLHLVRWKVMSSSQDCVLVTYSTWNGVMVANIGEWISTTIRVISNVDVVPTKCWTITWSTVNCILWMCHNALKRWTPFVVAEGENERIGSMFIVSTWIWK